MRRLVLTATAAVLFAIYPPLCHAVDTSNFAVENGQPKLHMNAAGRYVVSWIDPLKKRPVQVIVGNVSALSSRIIGLGGTSRDVSERGISTGVSADGTVLVSWRRALPSRGTSVEVRHWASFPPGSRHPLVSQSEPMTSPSFLQSGDEFSVSPNGASATGWATYGSSGSAVFAEVRNPAGPLQPNALVFGDTGLSGISDVQSFIDGDGVPTFVWERGGWGSGCDANGNNCAQSAFSGVQVADGDGIGGFLPPQTFGVSFYCEFGAFDQAPNGAAALILSCWKDGLGYLACTTRMPHQPFGELRQLSLPGRLLVGGHRDTFPSVRVLPDGRVVAVWLHYSKRTFRSKTSTLIDVARVQAASGTVSGGIGVPVFLTGNVTTRHAGFEFNDVSPVPLLSIGPGGQTFVSGRLRRDASCRIAAIHPDLTLGRTFAYAPARVYCGKVEIADTGNALTLVTQARLDGFRIIRFKVPAAG